jgi:hypothetical protein
MQFPSNATGSLPITAYQVLTNVLGTVPADMIFDGPVQVNGQVQLAAGRSAWPGGLTSEGGRSAWEIRRSRSISSEAMAGIPAIRVWRVTRTSREAWAWGLGG